MHEEAASVDTLAANCVTRSAEREFASRLDQLLEQRAVDDGAIAGRQGRDWCSVLINSLRGKVEGVLVASDCGSISCPIPFWKHKSSGADALCFQSHS